MVIMMFARHAILAADWVSKVSFLIIFLLGSHAAVSVGQLTDKTSFESNVTQSSQITNSAPLTSNQTISESSSQLEPIYFGAQYPPNHVFAELPLSQPQPVYYNNQLQQQYITSNPQGSFYTLTNDDQSPNLPTQQQQQHEVYKQTKQHKFRLPAQVEQQNLPANQLEQVILHSPDFQIEHSNEPLDQNFAQDPPDHHHQQQQQQQQQQEANEEFQKQRQAQSLAAASNQQKFPGSMDPVDARLVKAKGYQLPSMEILRKNQQLQSIQHPNYRRRVPYQYNQQGRPGFTSPNQQVGQNQNEATRQQHHQSQQVVSKGESSADIVTPQIQYKPSLASRQHQHQRLKLGPQQAADQFNLTHLLKPGQTLASENFTASNPDGVTLTLPVSSALNPIAGLTTQTQRFLVPKPLPAPQPLVVTQVSHLKNQVSVSEIEDLLKRLKSLAVGAGDKAKAEKVEDLENDDEQKGEVKEENERDEDNDDLNPIRESTSDPMGNLVAGKNNSKPSASEADMVFLNSLAILGDQLKGGAPNSDSNENDISERFYDGVAPRNKQQMAGSHSHTNENNASQNEKSRQMLKSIPIEVLVDHLMSGSRMASFGVQHGDHQSAPDGVNAAALSTGGEEEDDEDSEEDEEDDQDNNGTLPLEVGESAISLSRAIDPNTSLNFSSIMDHTNSWVPLGSLPLGSSPRLKDGSFGGDNFKNGDSESLLKRQREKRKKKKRKKKVFGKPLAFIKEAEDSGVVIGDKRLSRNELIRLIKLLNTMASKREKTKEREASRKLLKFLVKVALENYKKSMNRRLEKSTSGTTKTQRGGDVMRQSLRSILMGPDDQLNGRLANGSSGNPMVQLGPMGVSIQVTDDEEKVDDNEENPSTRKGKGRKSFGDVSEDLDQYFDGEFYEDLADKNANTNSSNTKLETIDSPSTSNATTVKSSSRLRRGSARKLGYKLPVPIYGQQQIEAADEDDVELDHVRLPLSVQSAQIDQQVEGIARERDAALRKRERSKATRIPRGKKRRKKRRKRGRRRQKLSDVTKKQDRDNDESEEVEVENDDVDGEPLNQKSESGSKSDNRKSRVAPNPAKKSSGIKSKERRRMRHKRVRDSRQEVDNQGEKPEEEDDEEESGVGDENQEQQVDGEKANDDSIDDRTVVKDKRKGDEEEGRNKKRRKRRRRKGASNNLDEEDKRDEIPAPIVKASTLSLDVDSQSKATSGLRSTEKEQHRKPKVPHKSNRKLAPAPTHSQKRVIVPKSKDKSRDSSGNDNRRLSKKSGNRKGEALKLQRRKRKGKKDREKSMRSDSDEPPDIMGDDDADYYNEGTSYSNVCDDDGKCQVSVQSNNPNIGKAIESNDETGIVKQLGKWIENPDTNR